jgi:hypothetical protein
MNWLIKNTFIIAALFATASCTKDEPASNIKPDLTAPVITITTPILNGYEKDLNPVNIVGTVTDNDLASMSVAAYNITDNAILYSKTEAITGMVATFNKMYAKTVTSPNNLWYCVAVVTANDKVGNSTVDSVFYVMGK